MTECIFCVSCRQKVENAVCTGLSRPKQIVPEESVNIFVFVALECVHLVPQSIRAKDDAR